MTLNSNQMSPNFLLWLVLGVFLMAAMLGMYATCQQLQTQAQAHAAAASGLRSQTELWLQMPPSVALATHVHLQGEILTNMKYYETLRAVDSDNVPTAFSMNEEEMNPLPVHNYKVSGPQNSGSTAQQASASMSLEKQQDTSKAIGTMKANDDELTCNVRLEQVNVGHLLHGLLCLHQFHAECVDPWLRQIGRCPVCKFRAGSGWHESRESEMDASDKVLIPVTILFMDAWIYRTPS